MISHEADFSNSGRTEVCARERRGPRGTAEGERGVARGGTAEEDRIGSEVDESSRARKGKRGVARRDREEGSEVRIYVTFPLVTHDGASNYARSLRPSGAGERRAIPRTSGLPATWGRRARRNAAHERHACPRGIDSARTSAGSARGKDGFDCPDELIHHVLSFLTSLETVRTGVLSRRWRHFWASIPCLNIAVRDFDNTDQFYKFILHALPRLDDTVPLRSFRLSSRWSYRAVLWVNLAVKRKVPVLECSDREEYHVGNLMLASSYLTKVVLKHFTLHDCDFGPWNNACPAL